MAFTYRRSSLATLALLGLLAPPTICSAATISFGTGPITGPAIFQQFDPSLGTLNSVTGFVEAAVQNRITSSTASAVNVPWAAKNFFGLYFGPTTLDITTTGSGTVDVVGGEAVVSTTGSGSDIWTDAAVLAYFTGVGNIFSGPTVDPPSSLSFGEPVLFAEPINRTYSFTVTYDFTPAGSGVPEPSTWAAMTLGIALAGATLRKDRRRRTMA